MCNYDLNLESNSERFHSLAKRLDIIVNEYKDNKFILNNPYIHLSRNHPEFVTIWKPVIYKSKVSRKDYLNLIKFFLFSFLALAKNIIMEMNLTIRDKKFHFNPNFKTDILFISHYVGTQSNDDDFYFGKILSYLSNSKNKVTRLLIPQENLKLLPSGWASYKSYFLNKKLPLVAILNYIIKTLISGVKLLFYSLSHNFTLFESLIICCGQMNNFINIKITYNVELHFNKLSPKKVIMTFEGNAIERSVFLICHTHKIESIGYQHAPIVLGQYSIFRTLHYTLEPDCIWTTGSYLTDKFNAKIGNIKPIYTIGSAKSYGGTTKNYNKGSTKNILLIPDGNNESVDIFFKLGFHLSKHLDRDQILIRCHPLLENYAKRKFNESKKQIPCSKFKLSTNSLEEDLACANWLVYQNSSVSIQALFFSCRLIYFAHKLANIDPLFDAKELRLEVGSTENILELINNSYPRNPLDKKKRHDFATKYFSSIQFQHLSKII